MAAGRAEVTGAIENVVSVSEELSAQVEEVVTSATSLTGLSRTLQQLVACFKLAEDGHEALATPPRDQSPVIWPASL